MSIHLCATADEAAEQAAVHVTEQARRSIAGRGRFVLALAGGSTPAGVYEYLARWPGIDWPKVEVFFGDERCVPPDDPKSNYRMAKEALLDHVPVRPEAVHRIPGEVEPEEAATVYSEDLLLTLGDDLRFDTILLGVGDDGHTASLFPDTPDLESESRIAIATRSPVAPHDRVSLSMATICHARNVTLLTWGKGKRDIVRRLLITPEIMTLPAGMAQMGANSFDWFMDRDAGSGVEMNGPDSIE